MDSQISMKQERPASVMSEQPSQSSRLTRNDQKWGSLRDEIQQMYKVEGKTFATTMRTIEESHGFKASVRKWKMQLKAWNFDKNISAMDMGIVAAKAEKRAREGKETIFFHGDIEISPERIEYFKKRKMTKLADSPSPIADTPTNITYYTPGPVSDEPRFEEPISTHPLQNSRPRPVRTPSLDSKRLRSPPALKGQFTTLEKEVDVNLADVMDSQLDSLSLKKNQPKITPDPNVGMSSPVESLVKPAVHKSILSATATGGETNKLQNPGFCSEETSPNSLALFYAVLGVYPYSEDKMNPMTRVSRVENIIVNLIHEVEQGESFQYAMSILLTHPEPFPVDNEPFPEGNDRWIYFHTVLLELARLYEDQGLLPEANLLLGFLEYSCGLDAWFDPRNLGIFKLRSTYTVGRVLENMGMTEPAEMEFKEALDYFHTFKNQLPTQEYSDLLGREIPLDRGSPPGSGSPQQTSASFAMPTAYYTNSTPSYPFPSPAVSTGSTSSTKDGLKTARRTVHKKMQRIREAIGDWVLPNDDDGFSSGWTTSTRSHRYGVTYSASEVTGISTQSTWFLDFLRPAKRGMGSKMNRWNNRPGQHDHKNQIEGAN